MRPPICCTPGLPGPIQMTEKIWTRLGNSYISTSPMQKDMTKCGKSRNMDTFKVFAAFGSTRFGLAMFHVDELMRDGI